MVNRFLVRLRGLLGRNRVDLEVDEELQFHLEHEIETNVARGMTAAEARRVALRDLGGVTQTREAVRDVRTIWIDSLWQDIRYAARRFRREPIVAAAAILTLSVSIGFNTALFTVIQSVLLRPLPYRYTDRLVAVNEMRSGLPTGPRRMVISPGQFVNWRDSSHSFAELAATEAAEHNPRVRFVITGEPAAVQVSGAAVTPNLFHLLGVNAHIGRTFADADGKPGHEKVVILGYGLWRDRFGADRSIVGRMVHLSGEPYTVIGVMPPSFKFTYPERTDVWVPIVLERAIRGAVMYTVVARLKPGVTVTAAQADMTRVYLAYNRSSRWFDSRVSSVSVVPLHEDVVGRTRPAFLMLVAAVGFVLLIACANIANLLLARVAARRREMAVRLALGAGRRRLVRQLLTESVLLALAGGAFGLLLAASSMPAVARLLPAGFPRTDELGVDRWVLVFALGISTLSGILFGLAPAFQGSQARVSETLKAAGPVGWHGRGGWLRGAFVVGEIALVLMLLTGAGLMINSLWRLVTVDLGFDSRNVAAMRLTLPRGYVRPSARAIAFDQQLIERVRALPGVTEASVTSSVPIAGVDYLGQFGIQGGRPAGPDQTARLRSIAPHYFSVMRIPVLRGRTFTDRDSAQAPKVAIISDACARQYFPGIDPIGHRVDAGYSDDPREIVGVVADVHLTQVRAGGAEPTIYMPLSQETGAVTWLVARAASPAALAGPIRQAVREIDPALPVELVTTMDHVVSESIADARFYAMSLGALACVALLLAAIGIYGVVSYSVGQRLTEIGIRLALGASRPAVFRTVLGHVAWLVAVGAAVGVAGAWALGRLVASFLFEVRPRDPWTLAAVTAALFLVAVLAACLPARRATRVDPIATLRCE